MIIILAKETINENQSMQISAMPIVATSSLAMSLIAISTPITSSMTSNIQIISWIVLLLISIMVILCCYFFINRFFYNQNNLSANNIKCIISHIVLIIFLSIVNLISHKIGTSTLLTILLILFQVIVFITSVGFFILGYFNYEILAKTPNIKESAVAHEKERCALKMTLYAILSPLCLGLGVYIMISSKITDIIGVIILCLLFIFLFITIVVYILSNKQVYIYVCFIIFVVIMILTLYLPQYLSSTTIVIKLFAMLLLLLGAIFVILLALQIIHHFKHHISLPNMNFPNINTTSKQPASDGV